MVASFVSSARSRRRTSVTSRTSTSAPASPPGGRSGSARTNIVADTPSTSMGSGNRPASAAEDPGRGRLPRHPVGRRTAGELGEVGAGQVAGHADPPVGRQRVRAGVGDPPAAVQPDEPVTDPGAHLGVLQLLRGEGAGRDHEAEVGGDVEVGELQRRRRPRDRQVGVLRQHRDDDAVVPHRDDLPPARGGARPVRLPLGHRPPLAVRDDEGLGDDAVHLGADEVLRPAGRRRERPHLRHAPPRAGRQRHPEGEVGEGEVGEQLPVGHQPAGVVDLRGADRAPAESVGEAAHGAPSLGRGAERHPPASPGQVEPGAAAASTAAADLRECRRQQEEPDPEREQQRPHEQEARPRAT